MKKFKIYYTPFRQQSNSAFDNSKQCVMRIDAVCAEDAARAFQLCKPFEHIESIEVDMMPEVLF